MGILRFFVTIVLLILLSQAGISGALAVTEHCPDHNGHPGKVEGGNLNDIVLDEGTEFCVKGSTEAVYVQFADGQTTLVEYLNNGHDVSYYVVYGRVHPSPPVETNNPSPSPSTEVPPSPSVGPSPSTQPCVEDEPCWNCETMGNRICGSESLPDTATEIPDPIGGWSVFYVIMGVFVGAAVLHYIRREAF